MSEKVNAPEINWSTTSEDAQLLHKIALRAVVEFQLENLQSLEMDLTAVHLNDSPLRLADFLAADLLNFAHDIFGIMRHLNRKTGKLENCFVPRFARNY